MSKLEKIKLRIKQWLKSKTLYLNTVVLPAVVFYGDMVATILQENILMLKGYVSGNTFLIIYIALAIYVRHKTTKSISEK